MPAIKKVSSIDEFLRLESASGILLLIAALLAMIAENSFAKPLYDGLLGTAVEIRVGELVIAKPLLLWINDGLMALFFFLVGLEIKREILRGELSDPSRVALPVIAAIGGMAVPAAVYAIVNWGDAQALRGWAIPAATDIAFAMGVLALLGKRVPPALKIFLLTLAIVDDLGAILVIAIFYTPAISLPSLAVAVGAVLVLFLLNRSGVLAITTYLLVATVLWVAVLKSGVHATLAGVVAAFFIPLRVPDRVEGSPLETLEEQLHHTVAHVILPVFAFANAGISFEGLSLSSLLKPVPLGIAAGLVIGKQIGVFGFAWVTVKLRIARLPEGVGWMHLYGASLLCGIGFTMSLFISALAFQTEGIGRAVDDRLGIVTGSFIAAIAGYLVLRSASPPPQRQR